MSTATRFKYPQPFNGCLPSSVPFGSDSVTVTLEQAMAIWWNLESLSFSATGGLNMSVDVGPTESVGFDPTNIGTRTRSGAYYDGSTPANAPVNRVCKSVATLPAISFSADRGSLPFITRKFEFILWPGQPVGGDIEIRYVLNMYIQNASSGNVIRNPSYGSIPTITIGSPPSSGTFSVLGVPMNWIGGNYAFGGWGATTSSLSVTSSPFTY